VDGLAVGSNSLRLSKNDATYNRQAAFNGSHVVGVILSLDQAGTYTATVSGANGETELCIDGKDQNHFTVGNGEAFFANVAPCGSVSSAKSGLSGGAIAGISIGVIAAVGAIAAVVLLVLKGIIQCPTRSVGAPLKDGTADSPYITDGI
jgi:hypothetical protein